MKTCILITLVITLFTILGFEIAYLLYKAPKYKYDTDPIGKCNITTTISHCGQCGQCSNIYDYNVYIDKKDSLTNIVKNCALTDVLSGKDIAIKCFDENAGLTPDCRDCWLKNIECTRKNCFFPCIWELICGTSQNIDDDTLSKCFACDEYNCLSGFLLCAGMSRRRAGIITDIERHSTEICDENYNVGDINSPNGLKFLLSSTFNFSK